MYAHKNHVLPYMLKPHMQITHTNTHTHMDSNNSHALYKQENKTCNEFMILVRRGASWQ